MRIQVSLLLMDIDCNIIPLKSSTSFYGEDPVRRLDGRRLTFRSSQNKEVLGLNNFVKYIFSHFIFFNFLYLVYFLNCTLVIIYLELVQIVNLVSSIFIIIFIFQMGYKNASQQIHLLIHIDLWSSHYSCFDNKNMNK